MLLAISVACGPPALLPSPAPLTSGLTREAGLGALGILSGADGKLVLPTAWYYRDRGGRVSYGVVMTPFPGALFRYWIVNQPRFRLGLEAQAGLSVPSGGVPMALQLSDRVWLTTNPSAIFYYDGLLFRLPIGASIQLHRRVALHLEVAALPFVEISLPRSVEFRPGIAMFSSTIGLGFRF